MWQSCLCSIVLHAQNCRLKKWQLDSSRKSSWIAESRDDDKVATSHNWELSPESKYISYPRLLWMPWFCQAGEDEALSFKGLSLSIPLECSSSLSHSRSISITLGPQEEEEGRRRSASSKWGKAGTRKRSIRGRRWGDRQRGSSKGEGGILRESLCGFCEFTNLWSYQ